MERSQLKGKSQQYRRTTPKASLCVDMHGLKTLIKQVKSRQYDEKVSILEKSRQKFNKTTLIKDSTPRATKFKDRLKPHHRPNKTCNFDQIEHSDRSWLGLTTYVVDKLENALWDNSYPDKENIPVVQVNGIQSRLEEAQTTIQRLECEIQERIQTENKLRNSLLQANSHIQTFNRTLVFQKNTLREQLLQQKQVEILALNEEWRKKHDAEMQELRVNIETASQKQYDYMKQQLLYRLQGNETRIRQEIASKTEGKQRFGQIRKQDSVRQELGDLRLQNTELREEVERLRERKQDVCSKCRALIEVKSQLDMKIGTLKAYLSDSQEILHKFTVINL